VTEIRIIPAPLALKPAILALSRATYEEHRARQPFAFPENGFEQTVVPLLDAAFRRETGQLSESPNIFAAMAGTDIAGYMLLSHWARSDGPDMHYVSIDDICVRPELRGKGIARALLDHARTLAATRDWDNLVATIWDGNTASRALFESAGFDVQSRTYRLGPTRQARNYPAIPGKAGWTLWGVLLWGLSVIIAALLIVIAILLLKGPGGI